MTAIFPRIVLAAALLLASPALAEMGPCKPDRFEGLTCGSGTGAARVIEETLSPDKRLAFAWRDPDAAPDVTPDTYQNMDFMLVRLADGAVLAKDTTEYWASGEGRANRRHETAIWSPDSRMVVRVYDTRFETAALQLFAVTPGAGKAAMLDLKKIVEPVVLKRMKAKPEQWDLSVESDPKPSLSAAGVLQLPLMMWQPKNGPMKYFAVTVRIARAPAGLSARVTRLRQTGEDPKAQ